ncbi:MAG: glycerol-3-phosphate dehydrogenase/oxidase [Anaerolineae bacterium]|nr:glycerol-3-phosphate dehydrogenase/oxidase [Anaerolineae bacterium]
MSRQEVFARLRQNPECSVLIVGAGINGIGTFRDLALQGVDVLMVDRGDFCGGASAASSHMLHGGIRYLEYGEFRLVREALTERNRLLQNAPHYAKPMPTTIPIFHWFSGVLNAPLKFLNLRDKPSERGAFIIKVGLMLYDFFTRGQQTLPAHRLHSREASLDFRPSINHDIVCTATYYDAWMPYPERIALELILDAEAENPQARALNYVSLDSAKGSTVTLRDELTGETATVKPRIVINAAGPWIDLANLSMGKQTQFIGGTKGSHIIVDHPELREACQGHEMFFENKDGRICLMFPLLDKVIIGTTDIRVDDPEKAECTEDEVEYMIDLVSHVFPTIKVERSQIVFWFCGVRPLPHSSASRTGAISRDHSIRVIEPDGSTLNFPVLSLVSGKWTTYRAFAEQATDQVLQRLQKPRVADTKKLAIGGGRDYPRAEADQQTWIDGVQSKTGIPADRIEQLFERYGTRAADIAAFIAAGSDQPFRAAPSFSHREVIFLAQREKVVHLEDFLLRRSLIAMLGLTTADLLEETAAVLAPVLGWSEDRITEEIERAVQILSSKCGVPLDRVRVSRKELA